MDKALTWFIGLWVGLVVLLNVVAMLGLVLAAEGLGSGLRRIAEVYSPFNVANWVMELVALAPALGAWWWRERRRQRT